MPADGKEAVEVVGMAAFAARGLQQRGQFHFWVSRQLHVLNPAFEPLARIIAEFSVDLRIGLIIMNLVLISDC